MFADLDHMSGGSIVTSTDGNIKEFITSKLVTLRTSNNLFLRFPLSEVPEKKKGAAGVRGLKLTKDDVITHVYVTDAVTA